MDIITLRALIIKEQNLTEETEGFWQSIFDAKVAILNENLDETIAFLDTCTEEEFDWISNAFEDISAKYRSWKFIECIKRNMLRFPNIQETIQSELKYALIYMGEPND